MPPDDACRATPAQAPTSTTGGTEGGAVTEDQQTRILRKQQLLTLPLLMDVCALYAPSNPALVQKLMQQALHLLPELQQVKACRTSAMPPFISFLIIIATLYGRGGRPLMAYCCPPLTCWAAIYAGLVKHACFSPTSWQNPKDDLRWHGIVALSDKLPLEKHVTVCCFASRL